MNTKTLYRVVGIRRDADGVERGGDTENIKAATEEEARSVFLSRHPGGTGALEWEITVAALAEVSDS